VLEKAGWIPRKNFKVNGRWEDSQVLTIINPEDLELRNGRQLFLSNCLSFNFLLRGTNYRFSTQEGFFKVKQNYLYIHSLLER
jgi:hypothetical protein